MHGSALYAMFSLNRRRGGFRKSACPSQTLANCTQCATRVSPRFHCVQFALEMPMNTANCSWTQSLHAIKPAKGGKRPEKVSGGRSRRENQASLACISARLGLLPQAVPHRSAFCSGSFRKPFYGTFREFCRPPGFSERKPGQGRAVLRPTKRTLDAGAATPR